MQDIFPENTVELILDRIESSYDFVVIDGGSDINLALGISALNSAGKIFYVVTQQRKTIERFLYTEREILRPLGLSGTLVINKYVREPALYGKGEIKTICACSSCFTVPYVEYGWQTEMEDKTLMKFTKYEKKIKEIVSEIEGKKKQGGIWKRNLA